MSGANGEGWIADGKDGKATLVYNENDDCGKCVIRVFGPDQEAIAARVVGLLNAATGRAK